MSLVANEGVKSPFGNAFHRASRACVPVGMVTPLAGYIYSAMSMAFGNRSALRLQRQRFSALKKLSGNLDRAVIKISAVKPERHVVEASAIVIHSQSELLDACKAGRHGVALVTDGRMSSASGKVPAAIHVTPEADSGGPMAGIRDGDIIRVDAVGGPREELFAVIQAMADPPKRAVA